jgi:hypothetical protein
MQNVSFRMSRTHFISNKKDHRKVIAANFYYFFLFEFKALQLKKAANYNIKFLSEFHILTMMSNT